jgi:hypothetical protein
LDEGEKTVEGKSGRETKDGSEGTSTTKVMATSDGEIFPRLAGQEELE